MNFLRILFLATAMLPLNTLFGETVNATFNSASDIPVTAASYTAVGNNISLALNYAPTAGTNLTVVRNTGLPFINGQFTNLPQGQSVNLTHAGKTYRFIANYFGGSGNDLVLEWPFRNVTSWGSNKSGQLGNNTTTSSIPVSVTKSGVLSGKTVVTVAAGYSHSLALCSDGTLVAWGRNYYGQLGNNSFTDSSVPVLVDKSGALSSKTVVAVSVGYYHNLALCSDGEIVAWGSNDYGQLGNDTIGSSSIPVILNQRGVLLGKTVVAVSAGERHSLALCSDGTIAAWGHNFYGQLGNNSFTNSSVPVLVTQSGVLSGKSVVSVSAGYSHSLALCSDGTIAAWGRNDEGRLGNNSTSPSSVPVLVTQSGVLSGKTVVTVAAGYSHSLALCSDGTIAAWGSNTNGQLGNNSTTDSSVPVLVTQSEVLSGITVVAVSAGNPQNLALCSDGNTVTWGSSSKIPVLVPRNGVLSGKTMVAVSVSSGNTNNLALCSDGTIAAWDQYENNSHTDSVPVMATHSGVLSGKTVIAMSAGEGSAGTAHSLVLCSDGTIAAWGRNDYGQFGNNSFTYSIVPVVVDQSGVLSGKTVVAVSAGQFHSLALCSDGTIAAWGRNDKGQLGNKSFTNSSVPVLVDSSGVLSGKTVVAVSAGTSHNLALCSDGTIVAWGANYYGQLGNNRTRTNNSIPVLVTQSGVLSGKSVVSVSAGYDHSLALCSDGTIVAWGRNYYGALGNNSTADTSVPVLVDSSGVLSGKTVVAVSAGSLQSLALCSDGTIVAWGNNSSGQLGNNSFTNSSVPVLVDSSGVLSGKAVVSVSAGLNHSIALCSDGTIVAWGANSEGQLGNNSTQHSIVPTLVVQSGVLDGGAAVAMSAGADHNLVLVNYDNLNNNNLANLSLSAGSINPQFNPNTTDYNVDVSYAVSSITVLPSAVAEGFSVIKVNNNLVISGTYSPAIPLELGSNFIKILVTAPNGSSTKTYTIQVTRKPQVTTLESLVPINATLSPAFVPNITNYAISVSNTTTSICVRPTVTDASMSIKVNGINLASGQNSQPISLAEGYNTITVAATSRSSAANTTYNIVVTRVTANLPTLSSLSLSSGALSPPFASNILNYTATVSNATSSISVTPIANNTLATVHVNGSRVTSGTASQNIPLIVGSNTITVVGTAEDGTTMTYTLIIQKYLLSLVNDGSTERGTFAMSWSTVDSASLAASPSPGYLFGSWNGAASGSNNPTTVLMDSNKTVGATFVEDTRDPDNDGLTSYQEIIVRLTNPNVADSDSDGVHDGQEITDATNPLIADTDGDGLNDGEEKTIGTNPLVTDTDGDTYGDGYEVQFSSDPKSASSFPTYTLMLTNNGTSTGGTFAKTGTLAHGTNATLTATPLPGYLFGSWNGAASGSNNPNTVLMNSNKTVGATFVEDTRDPDNDGLTNYQEIIVRLTNPNVSDSDNDGVNDGQEVADATNPLVADTDADGLTDGEEKARNTNPLAKDTDGDGLSDLEEELNTKTNPLLADTDGDTISDALEDTDNDGISNLREVTELKTDPLLVDTDADGLSDTYELIYKGSVTAFAPRIGDRLRFELRELVPQGTLKLVGALPTGLSFNAVTGVLEGKLTGKPGVVKLSIQVLNGKTVLRTIPLQFTVLAFPSGLIGTWQVLLEDANGSPQGMITTLISSPGVWSAQYDSLGTKTLRSSKGVFDLTPSMDRAAIAITFPVVSLSPAFSSSWQIDATTALAAGSYAQGTLRGFRLAKTGELPTASRQITLVIDQGEQDGYQIPAGLGWATGTLGTTGSLPLSGQLGDAQSLKTTVRLSATGQAMMWVKPYRNLNSFIGGIISLRDIGVVTQSPYTSIRNGLSWHRVADNAELSYSSGFGPLAADASVNLHNKPSSSLIFSANLGLSNSEFRNVVFDGGGLPSAEQFTAMPERFVMDSTYKLNPVALPGRVMALWQGVINSTAGSFTGTIALDASNSGILKGNANVSGVVFRRNDLETVGAGLIKIPTTGLKGSFRTGAFLMDR